MLDESMGDIEESKVEIVEVHDECHSSSSGPDNFYFLNEANDLDYDQMIRDLKQIEAPE